MLLHDHLTTVSGRLGENSETYGISSDKRKWNHGHSISKLVLVLLPFVEELLHPFVFKMMSMWEKRKIKPPHQLLKAIAKYEHIDTDNPDVVALHNCLKYGIENEIFKAGKCTMHIQHGFMQGILHYTSSWLHVLVLHR